MLNFQDSLYSNFQKAADLKNKTGESTQLEKIAAETRLMEIMTNKKKVLADIVIFKKRLQLLLNEATDIDISDSVLLKLPFAPGNDSSAIANNPTLGIAQQEVIIQNYQAKAETAGILPDFSIGYFNQSNKTFRKRPVAVFQRSFGSFIFGSQNNIQAANINKKIPCKTLKTHENHAKRI